MAPLQPGDVVVCVDVSGDPLHLAIGAVYRVESVMQKRLNRGYGQGLIIQGLRSRSALMGGYGSYHAWRFRKIDDEVTEEFREQLAKLPVQERVS